MHIAILYENAHCASMTGREDDDNGDDDGSVLYG